MEPLSPTLIFSIFTACNVATIQNLLHFGAGTNIQWQNRSFRTNLSLFATSVGLFTFVRCTGSVLVGGPDVPSTSQSCDPVYPIALRHFLTSPIKGRGRLVGGGTE